MPETATQASPSTTRLSSSVKSSAPRSTPAKITPAWPAVSQAAPPTVQLGSVSSPSHQSAGGEPLQPGIRSTLEGSLGVDLGSVRVHSDSHAQNTARNLST